MFGLRITPFRIALIICVLGFILTITLCGIYFRFSYFEPDTVSYLFQAKLFAHGKLCEKAPPEFGFSSSPHINILNGKWYSKYPFGNALMLTLGVFVNAPWLIPAIVTSLSLLLLYLLLSEFYDVKIALLATALGLISPATLVMGATWFSEPVSRFFLVLFLFALIKSLPEKCSGGLCPAMPAAPWRRWFYPVLAGFSLGYVLNTRPLTAFAFGLCSGIFLLYWIARSRVNEKKRIIKAISIFLIPFVAMVFVCMAWNYYFTGNPLKFTHNAAQPHDKIGFGKRTEGYDADLEHAFVFTPEYSRKRLWQNVLPCISLNTLGWGYYQPNIFRSNWKNDNPLQFLRIIPLIFPFILMLVPVFHHFLDGVEDLASYFSARTCNASRGLRSKGRHSRNRYDFLFLSFFLATGILYFFFYFDGSTFGFTAINARYYTECTLLAIIPLIARGIFIIYGSIRSIMHKRLRIAGKTVFFLIFVILTINTVHTYILQATPLQNWGAVYQKLPRLVKEEDIHNAVVFIPHHRGAPLGEYPFKSLENADVVYFKLGPSKRWKLTNSDWKAVWNKYFKAREPYIYEGGRLTQLEVD